MDQRLIIAAAIFFLVCVAFYGLSTFFGSRRNKLQDRLGQLGGGANPFAGASAPDMPQPSTTLRPGSRSDMQLPTINAFLEQNNLSRKLRLGMLRAGLRIRPAEFVVIIVVSALLFASLGFVCTKQVITTFVMGVLGFNIPIIVVAVKQSSRKAKFDAQIPDVLVLMASSLRTGYSFMHAMELVVKEMEAPISEEFAWALGEATLGVSVDTVLERMVTRMRSYDLELVATAVVIQLQVGGNLAEILDTIANTIRERIRLRGEIAALTAEGKLSGIILFCMPIVLAIFIILRSPSYFDPLISDPMGLTWIWGILFIQVIGGLIISQMVKMDL
jgi:tight adherence protein B